MCPHKLLYALAYLVILADVVKTKNGVYNYCFNPLLAKDWMWHDDGQEKNVEWLLIKVQ